MYKIMFKAFLASFFVIVSGNQSFLSASTTAIRIDDLYKQGVYCRANHSDLRVQLDTEQHSSALLQQRFDDLLAEDQNLQDDNQNLLNRLSAQERSHEDLTRQVTEGQAEIDTLKDDLQQLEAAQASLQEQLGAKDLELDRLKAKAQQRQEKLQAEIDALKDSLHQSEAAKARLQEQLGAKDLELESLKTETQQRQGILQAEIVNLRNALQQSGAAQDPQLEEDMPAGLQQSGTAQDPQTEVLQERFTAKQAEVVKLTNDLQQLRAAQDQALQAEKQLHRGIVTNLKADLASLAEQLGREKGLRQQDIALHIALRQQLDATILELQGSQEELERSSRAQMEQDSQGELERVDEKNNTSSIFTWKRAFAVTTVYFAASLVWELYGAYDIYLGVLASPATGGCDTPAWEMLNNWFFFKS